MKKGEIFRAIDPSNHPHPIVFIEKIDNEKFKACILSTKDTNGNIKMEPDHFYEKDENGGSFTITFKNSHLVPKLVLEKEYRWLKTEKPEGKLTDKGIAFIDKYLKDIESICLIGPIWADR